MDYSRDTDPAILANLTIIREAPAGILHISRKQWRGMSPAQQEALNHIRANGMVSYWRPAYSDGYSYKLNERGLDLLMALRKANAQKAESVALMKRQDRQARYVEEALF